MENLMIMSTEANMNICNIFVIKLYLEHLDAFIMFIIKKCKFCY